LYLEVETAANPGGEVRGQLMLAGAQLFVTDASPAEELPPVASSHHAHASFILSPDQGTLLYHVVTVAPATDVRLQRAIGGLVGPVSDDLSPIAPTMDGSLQIAAADPADLASGHLYLNIVTAQNLAGELRGQLIKPGESLLAGVLSGAAESPPTSSTASGGAQAILSADRSSLRYEVVVSGTIPTSAELDGAVPGKNGPVIVPLTLAPQGALGMTPIGSSDAALLLKGDAYVNIKTASYVGGELRASLALE
ncbi:MAG: CHRD domain-containing protein, partial [Polyangiaceae bacterium]